VVATAPATDDNETAKEVMPGHKGHLMPWANPVTGILGWQITTGSRRLAVAVATTIPGTAIHRPKKGEWQARIPHPSIMAIVIGADTAVLWCRVGNQPTPGTFTLAFAPWPATTVLKCPPAALPARGQLSVRDIQVTTRMGRTVRYLVPAFTT
jgi:hypothetical protein